MSWTYDKIYTLLSSKQYEIRQVLKCGADVYMDVFSIRTAESIMLRVQSSLQVPSSTPVYFCKSLVSKPANEELKEFTHVPESFIEKTYSEKNYDYSLKTSTTQLTDTYKQKVIMDDMEGEERMVHTNLFSQLRRLKYCVNGMTQSVALLQAGVLAVLEEFDRIHLYQCNRLKKNAKDIQLYLVVDLPSFVDKMEFIEKECSQILSGVYTILISNQKIHSNHIQRLVEKTKSVPEDTAKLYAIQDKYTNYIAHLKSLLDEIHLYETEKTTEYETLKSQTIDSLQQDMKRMNQVRKLEKELIDMGKTKKEILQNLETLKRNKTQLVLDVDSLLFNNLVWLNKLIEHLDAIKKYSKTTIH